MTSLQRQRGAVRPLMQTSCKKAKGKCSAMPATPNPLANPTCCGAPGAPQSSQGPG